MATPCTVLIGASDLLPALKERTLAVNGEVLAFPHTEALQALQTITRRRPRVVALERLFAATPRGAALISRIKADPKLLDAEIRVLSHDSDYTRVVPRAQKPVDHALDQRGTRRAPRFKIAPKVDVIVDKARAALIDLSTIGAQVISPGVLKPNQRVRVALTDPASNVQFDAAVAWASFDIPPNSGPRYRAGLEFIDADPVDVDAFIDRHKNA